MAKCLIGKSVILIPVLTIAETLSSSKIKNDKLELKNIKFKTTVYRRNSKVHSVDLEPQIKMQVLNNFLVTYRNLNSVEGLLTELEAALQLEKPGTREITVNESHIYADKHKAIFDMEVVTQLKPIEIEIHSAIEFFRMYKQYLQKYEN